MNFQGYDITATSRVPFKSEFDRDSDSLVNYTDPTTDETGISSTNSDMLTGVYRWDSKSYKSGKRVYVQHSGILTS